MTFVTAILFMVGLICFCFVHLQPVYPAEVTEVGPVRKSLSSSRHHDMRFEYYSSIRIKYENGEAYLQCSASDKSGIPKVGSTIKVVESNGKVKWYGSTSLYVLMVECFVVGFTLLAAILFTLMKRALQRAITKAIHKTS